MRECETHLPPFGQGLGMSCQLLLPTSSSSAYYLFFAVNFPIGPTRSPLRRWPWHWASRTATFANMRCSSFGAKTRRFVSSASLNWYTQKKTRDLVAFYVGTNVHEANPVPTYSVSLKLLQVASELSESSLAAKVRPAEFRRQLILFIKQTWRENNPCSNHKLVRLF